MSLDHEISDPRIGARGIPVRREVPVVASRLPTNSPAIARYAAEELRRLAELMFESQPDVRLISDGAGCSDSAFLMIAATTGGASVDLAVLKAQPRLDEQEYSILPLSRDDQVQAVALAGGSPAALLWAVYDLAEFWGARFLLTGESFPPRRKAFSLPGSAIRRKPTLLLRAWRGLNQLPHSGIYWGLADYRELIDRLARLRFNCFYVMLPPYGPFVDYQWVGLRKRTAELDFGWRFPIDQQTVGREHFNGSPWYENPDIPHEGTYDQKIRSAVKLIDGIRAHARARGMSFAVRFTFTEFPEEFKEHLRTLSLSDGFEPAETKSGYVYRLGISREGMDPTYTPFMSVRNPRFVDLVAAQLRAYLERFSDADYLVLHPPEFANSSADAEYAWGMLSETYGLGPVENLQRLIDEAANRNRQDFCVVAAQRVEQQVRGHICSLYLLARLLREDGLSSVYRNSGARLVVGVPFSNLAPLTAQVCGDDIELMTSLGTGYLASDAARHADELKRPLRQDNRVHLTVSIEDDNIGLTPQFTAPSLEKIMVAMRRHEVSGLWCRQWLLSKIEPAVFYLSRACWDDSLTPSAAYDDLARTICGPAAWQPLLEAFAFAEQVTLENDVQGNIHSFLTPSLLVRYWDREATPKATLLAMRPKYRKLGEMLEVARSAARPESHWLIDSFIGQCRFAEQWIDVIEKTALAAEANHAARTARDARDIHAMDAQLQMSLRCIDEALAACRGALQSWASAVRDRADLGALAALNHFGHRFLASLRHVQYIHAEQWGVHL